MKTLLLILVAVSCQVLELTTVDINALTASLELEKPLYIGFDMQDRKLMALSEQNQDRLNVGFVECETATKLCEIMGVSEPTLLFFPAM